MNKIQVKALIIVCLSALVTSCSADKSKVASAASNVIVLDQTNLFLIVKIPFN